MHPLDQDAHLHRLRRVPHHRQDSCKPHLDGHELALRGQGVPANGAVLDSGGSAALSCILQPRCGRASSGTPLESSRPPYAENASLPYLSQQNTTVQPERRRLKSSRVCVSYVQCCIGSRHPRHPTTEGPQRGKRNTHKTTRLHIFTEKRTSVHANTNGPKNRPQRTAAMPQGARKKKKTAACTLEPTLETRPAATYQSVAAPPPTPSHAAAA